MHHGGRFERSTDHLVAALHFQFVSARINLDQAGFTGDKIAFFKGWIRGGNLTANFGSQQQCFTRLNGAVSLYNHRHFFGPGRKYFDQAAGVLDNPPFGFGPQDNQNRSNDNGDQNNDKDPDRLKGGPFFHDARLH